MHERDHFHRPYRWVVLLVYTLVARVSQMLWLNFAPQLTEVQQRYGVSELLASTLVLVFPLLYVLLSLPAGLLTLLRDTADRGHVQLLFTPPQALAVLRTQAAALEQVLSNVMLNAVQQITELRGETGGWVQVHLDADEARHKSHFYIYIEDNGPGIHASQWETIFEPGYTTRAEGSGIGLYVSRNLVEEIGGRLFVQASTILGGTTFVLELPRQNL